MRISVISTLVCLCTSVVHAIPIATPVEGAVFELRDVVETMFQERFYPEQVEDFKGLIQKRGFELTVESLLTVFNDSGILWDILDQVAYYPDRILMIANYTGKLLKNFDIGSVFSTSLKLDLNYSAIYDSVADSGLVTSLLDGLLLDEEYRPVLVNLTSRILEGNKNLFLYLVQDIFKKSKRDEGLLEKRETSSLTTFVTNIISAALGSSLVGGIANDVVVALNNTGVAVDIVKRFIANEGYQNMTAQLVLDVINTGDITLGNSSINITSIASTALSNPTVIVGLVSSLLSGNIQLSGLGEYTDAIKDIVVDVQSQGVFKDLNEYVFSEIHTVTTPLIPTNQIVVARTTTSKRSATTTKTSANSNSTRTTSTRSGSTSSMDASASGSAAEVNSILALLRGSTTQIASSSSSTANLNAILSALRASTTTSTASSTDAIDSSVETGTDSSSAAAGLAEIMALLGQQSTTSAAAREQVVASVSSSAPASTSLQSGSNANHANGAIAKALVYTQAVLLGGLLLL